MAAAELRYGSFASIHEALGVASEEWDELRAAIHANDLDQVCGESFDLIAVLIRLVTSLQEEATRERSQK